MSAAGSGLGVQYLLFPICEIKEWTELLFGNLSSIDMFAG